MRKILLTNCSTQKIWFERFVRGVDLQIGIKLREEHAILVDLMKLLTKNMEAAVK